MQDVNSSASRARPSVLRGAVYGARCGAALVLGLMLEFREAFMRARARSSVGKVSNPRL